MSADRRASERGSVKSQLRHVALVALLAIASSALLPLVHGSLSHVGDCGVCTALTHNGASAAETVPAPALASFTARPEAARLESCGALPRRDFALRSARAPPSTIVIG